LLSYVVFADWLFFGLTAGALLIVRYRQPSPGGEIAYAPGHPVTTILFVGVAAGVVLNSFVAYPTQSLIGSSILIAATIVYFVLNRHHGGHRGSTEGTAP
jgi:APA family basic amino acid/polyamine antiporter